METPSGVNTDLKTDEEKQPRSAAPLSTASIDINAADARVLDRLPGIGPAMAKRIVEYRDRSGPFGRAEDLLKVKGIGPKKFEQLRQFIIVK
ncbi:MAG: helix-hairpin-helix domain-containing protein [Bacteroidetes bacterium]|nr:helix-hairpin-helix domain-containing protein [Bacteroidota bacterium]